MMRLSLFPQATLIPVTVILALLFVFGAAAIIGLELYAPSTYVELLTVNPPKEARVGEPLVISGLVRDPTSPNGPFGLPSAGIRVTITAPEGSVESLFTTTSMSGTWQILYTPRSLGIHHVQVRAECVKQEVTAEFVAV